MHILRRSQIAGEVDLIEGSIGRACETLVYGSLVDGIDRRCDRLILQACQWIEAIKTGCVSRTNLLKEWSWPSPGQLQTWHVRALHNPGRPPNAIVARSTCQKCLRVEPQTRKHRRAEQPICDIQAFWLQ